MKNPTITVLMPTYRRPHTVGRAIESVLRQTFSDWEFIIIDDASVDGTAQVLAKFAARDKRIRILRNEKNLYISGALNRGLDAAAGEFIARVDDDDYWIDDQKLQKQVDFLRAHPDHVVVGGGVIVIDGSGKELYRYFKKESDGDIRKSALFANPFSHTTALFRTDAARKAGGYPTERYAEDWDLWLRMGNAGKLHNLQEYVTAYTMDESSSSFVYQRPQSKRILQIIKSHRKEYPGFLGAYALNSIQYAYSFLPLSLRLSLHSVLSSLKRRSF